MKLRVLYYIVQYWKSESLVILRRRNLHIFYLSYHQKSFSDSPFAGKFLFFPFLVFYYRPSSILGLSGDCFAFFQVARKTAEFPRKEGKA